jgi:hypothetical protein
MMVRRMRLQTTRMIVSTHLRARRKAKAAAGAAEAVAVAAAAGAVVVGVGAAEAEGSKSVSARTIPVALSSVRNNSNTAAIRPDTTITNVSYQSKSHHSDAQHAVKQTAGSALLCSASSFRLCARLSCAVEAPATGLFAVTAFALPMMSVLGIAGPYI